MKKEFLQGLGLTQEAMDKDIEAEKARAGGISAQLAAANAAIRGGFREE